MLTALFLAVGSLATGCAFEGPFQDLTLDQALAAAKRDNKVVVIDFFTTWCVPCKKLDTETWSNPEVQKWLAEKTVALKLDAEKEAEIAKRFGVQAYPTIVLLKADGTKLDQLVGFKQPKDFLTDAQAALEGKSSVTRAREKVAGHEKDPSLRERLGDELMRAGQYEESLAEYLWCFDHGDENQWNGYAGVRLSFLLSDLARLGAVYPPAWRAMEERRNQCEEALLAGTGTWSQISDASALNDYLKTPQRTLELYDRMKDQKRLTADLRFGFVQHIGEMLVEKRRYQDFLELSGDPVKAVEFQLTTAQTEIKLEEGMKREGMPDSASFSRNRCVSEVGRFYEAALGTRQRETADHIADRLITFAPAGSTYVALIERAVHAGDSAAAQALAERGRSSLAEKEKNALERAAKKIPAPK